MACPFCQNWQISQGLERQTEKIDADSLITHAKEQNSIGIAFTYSEPLIHYEYLLHTAQAVRAAGLKTVLVSNGYLNDEPSREILPYMDAANIDLKSFKENSYTNVLRGGLTAVQNFIRIAFDTLHLELTCLIVPGLNDDMAEIRSMSQWISSLSPDIPFHVSAYHPAWSYAAPATGKACLEEAAKVARESLNYVYPGNVHGIQADTLCPACGRTLISRNGYDIRVFGQKTGHCPGCGKTIPIIIEDEKRKSP
jgi:pyruvate formate lyase activating enzyme